MIRTLAKFTTSLFLLAATFACNAAPQVDVDYRLINPPDPGPDKKIEIVEFFSYNCPHCADFEPSVRAWLKRKPADVDYRSVPLDLGHDEWRPAAKLFHCLDRMGIVEKYHQKVFDAIHKEGKVLNTDQAVKDWAKSVGIDAAKFNQEYDSPTVDLRLVKGINLGKAYGARGTPSIAVNGTYMTGPRASYDEFFKMLDQLIDMERRGAR